MRRLSRKNTIKYTLNKAYNIAQKGVFPLYFKRQSPRLPVAHHHPDGGGAPQTPTTSLAKDSLLTLARRTGSETARQAGSLTSVE